MSTSYLCKPAYRLNEYQSLYPQPPNIAQCYDIQVRLAYFAGNGICNGLVIRLTVGFTYVTTINRTLQQRA